VSCLAWHPLDHGLAVGSLAAHSKVGLYTHQGGRQQQQAGQPGEPRQLSTQVEAGQAAGYPQTAVARLISGAGREREDTRTPTDLQDIVEKLNTALRDCRMKNNLLEEQQPESA